jgi:hypothetical protein
MAPLSRITLQGLATAKVTDARLLYDNRRFSNSYYLYGYGIELGLKACIARQISAETIPDKAVLTGFLDHQIGRLVGLAGLADALKTEKQTPAFDSRWSVVAEWSVDARYDMIDSVAAAAMADAVEHAQYGVMRWLQLHW